MGELVVTCLPGSKLFTTHERSTTNMFNVDAIAARIATKVVMSATGEAFAVAPYTLETPPGGYMVNLAGASQTVVAKTNPLALSNEIARYLDSRMATLSSVAGVHVVSVVLESGSNQTSLHLSLSVVVGSRPEAYELAYVNQQLTYFDLYEGVEIPVYAPADFDDLVIRRSRAP